MRRVVAILGPIAIAGCSLLTSLDGYSGGASAADGGAPAASEAGAAPPSPEAGVDAPSGPKDFCATFTKAPRFCVDFADGTLVAVDSPKSFDDMFQKGTAPKPVLDSAFFATAAPSARFAIPASTRSYLSRTFLGASPDVLEFGMAIRIDAQAQQNDLMEIRLGQPNAFTAAVYLSRGAGGALEIAEAYDLPDGGTGWPTWALSRTMPPDTWVRFVWKVDASGVLTVTMNGDVALQQQLDAPPIVSPGITFVAGCTDTNHDSTVWVDDVYADF